MNIVFDIGGTKMRIAAAEGETLGQIRKVPTPQDPHEGINILMRIAREIAGNETIGAFAGCVSGSVNEAGEISDARNLPSWKGMNIVQVLRDAAGVPVHIVNDAALAGFGEARAGAGRGAAVVMYITVSTGVGGARIADGKIDASGGIGHTPLRGSDLESLVSGTAVKKKFGIEPKDLESLEERNKLADILAEGLAIIAQKWTPDTIVLGGSMIVGINPIPIARTEETLRSMLTHYPKVPVLKMAQLGDNGGLIGAAILATRA